MLHSTEYCPAASECSSGLQPDWESFQCSSIQAEVSALSFLRWLHQSLSDSNGFLPTHLIIPPVRYSAVFNAYISGLPQVREAFSGYWLIINQICHPFSFQSFYSVLCGKGFRSKFRTGQHDLGCVHDAAPILPIPPALCQWLPAPKLHPVVPGAPHQTVMAHDTLGHPV